MSLGSFFDRLGDNIGNAPKESWFTLAQALSAAPGDRPLQGLAQGISGFGQAAETVKKRKTLADALKGAMGDYSPQQQALLGALEPQQAAGILGGNLFPKPSERWEQIDTDGDGKPDRQRSMSSGKIDDIPMSLGDRERLARAGASSVTVNALPAEVAARIGLGEGFLRNYDSIKAKAQKFYGSKSPYEQVKRRGQLFFNTGEGGELWRAVESGKEALVRQLTGAGMAQAEAENQASRYGLSALDTDYDALSKLEGLRQDLINTATGAYKGRGGTYTPPASGVDNSDVDKILGLE